MKNNSIIRKAKFEDLEALAFLEQSCFSEPWSVDGIKSMIETVGSFVVVIEIEEKILGYAAYTSVLDEGMIANICVDPHVRNQGFGSQLLKELIREGKAKGLSVLFLEVRVSNEPAICLYEKEGFVKVGTRKNFYRKPLEDAFIYRKILGKEEEL